METASEEEKDDDDGDRRRKRMKLKQTTKKKKKKIIMCGTTLGLRVQLIRAVNGTLRLRTNQKSGELIEEETDNEIRYDLILIILLHSKC